MRFTVLILLLVLFSTIVLFVHGQDDVQADPVEANAVVSGEAPAEDVQQQQPPNDVQQNENVDPNAQSPPVDAGNEQPPNTGEQSAAAQGETGPEDVGSGSRMQLGVVESELKVAVRQLDRILKKKRRVARKFKHQNQKAQQWRQKLKRFKRHRNNRHHKMKQYFEKRAAKRAARRHRKLEQQGSESGNAEAGNPSGEQNGSPMGSHKKRGGKRSLKRGKPLEKMEMTDKGDGETGVNPNVNAKEIEKDQSSDIDSLGGSAGGSPTGDEPQGASGATEQSGFGKGKKEPKYKGHNRFEKLHKRSLSEALHSGKKKNKYHHKTKAEKKADKEAALIANDITKKSKSDLKSEKWGKKKHEKSEKPFGKKDVDSKLSKKELKAEKLAQKEKKQLTKSDLKSEKWGKKKTDKLGSIPNDASGKKLDSKLAKKELKAEKQAAKQAKALTKSDLKPKKTDKLPKDLSGKKAEAKLAKKELKAEKAALKKPLAKEDLKVTHWGKKKTVSTDAAANKPAAALKQIKNAAVNTVNNVKNTAIKVANKVNQQVAKITLAPKPALQKPAPVPQANKIASPKSLAAAKKTVAAPVKPPVQKSKKK